MAACSNSSLNFNRIAEQIGLQSVLLVGRPFAHASYVNSVGQPSKTLHVYLGGDGSPWFEGRYVTRDPTPLNPVMLRLMAMDDVPSIYLGRPCYHQRKMPANCDARLWTAARYSRPVVDSMVAALNAYVRQQGYQRILLFGFSGGGTLAMLMAPLIPEVEGVVTLAGNLDTEAWIDHHRYEPLKGSLNPAAQTPLPARIRQIHLVGGQDKNVPSHIVLPVISKQVNPKLILLQNADHHCCWEEHWLGVLKMLP